MSMNINITKQPRAQVKKYSIEDIKQLFEHAIKKKCANAQYILGKYYVNEKKNFKQGFNWYLQAAEQGLDVAQYRVADCYGRSQGVEHNMEEAFKWCKKSADLNDSYAQCQLGYYYENGLGVEKNMLEAVKWYTKSSNNNMNCSIL